jgi:hypothetical protein
VSWQDVDSKRHLVTIFEVERTYKDTENTYSIMAAITQGIKDGTVETVYHVEVTGGVFGDIPQVCGNASPQYFDPLPTPHFIEAIREGEKE